MSRGFASVYPERADSLFVTSDPEGSQLGSGGGTVHLLLEAYRKTGSGKSFLDWLSAGQKCLIHGSGESRRLQSYSSQGKPMIPLPDMPSRKAIPAQPALIDLQIESYSRIARIAPESYRVMVTCGDVHLSFSELIPAFPEADILFVGMLAPPEEAQHHGVMICDASNPSHLLRFLQKPEPETLCSLDSTETFLLDTGVWLFSEKAVLALMGKCGIDPESVRASDLILPKNYDMFSTFGPALGDEPVQNDPDISPLRGAVLALPDSKFYHFGSSSSIIASTAALLAPAEDKRSFANASLNTDGAPILVGSTVAAPLSNDNRHIWIENSFIGSDWSLCHSHIITGIPENSWALSVPASTCLSLLPLQDGSALKFYGFEDAMRGTLAGGVQFMGAPLSDWLSARNLSSSDLSFALETDIYDLPLFPVLHDLVDAGPMVQWLIAKAPETAPHLAEAFINSTRVSARDTLSITNLEALQQSRIGPVQSMLEHSACDPAAWSAHCRAHDLSSLAKLVSCNSLALPPAGIEWKPGEAPSLALGAIHEKMLQDECGFAGQSEAAFSLLRDLIVHEMEISPIAPKRNVMEDQLVWGRSPLRLDLAGGWSDTPPYCLEHGGRVVNLSVDLNGQPPIQVFARINNRKDILLRSIDLGVSETIPSYEALLEPAALGSEFGIARAALALCGFDPRFHTNHSYRTLQKQLDAEFGGGIELSMVCAVPKGSGLGTSSILAATVIGTLNELCGLGLNTKAISQRTLALEQLLTSGGGWQDQIGGITPGVKILKTGPSIAQDAEISWLPGNLFESEYANRTVLLYYTGITRVAHDILGEIVRNMFLNSAPHLSIIDDIAANALYAAEACQKNNLEQLHDAVRRSWRLNQLLDAGTNPPAVQAILDRVGDAIAACKLLGAGGGGYMLIFAKDESAAHHIRDTLNAAPPNKTSRFVDLALSSTGLQVTKS